MITSISEAEKFVSGLQSEEAKTNLKFLNGDHWQEGTGWIGATATKGSEYEAIFNAKLARQFVPSDVIGDVLSTAVNGAIGRAPEWSLAGSDDKTLIQQATDLLKKWLIEEKAHSEIKRAGKHALATKRGALRLFLDDVQRNDDGLIPQMDLGEAFDAILLEAPSPDVCGVKGKGKRKRAVCLTGSGNEKSAEYVTVSKNGETEISVIQRVKDEEGNTADKAQPWSVDLNKQLTIYEMTTPLLIKKPIQQQQRAMNVCNTSMLEAVIDAGFRRIYFLNADTYEVVHNEETGKEQLVAIEMDTGPGTYTSLAGIPTNGGGEGYTKPDVKTIEPASIEIFVKAKKELRESVYREVSQEFRSFIGNRLGSDTLSQWRGTFVDTLDDLQTEMVNVYTWLLPTVLKLAATLSGEDDKFDGLSLVVKGSGEKKGKNKTDKIKEVLTAWEKGLISRQTALEMCGIDPAEEVERIRSEVRTPDSDKRKSGE